jgi:hypothetical protein
MATNPLGSGTKNLPVNFLAEELKVLGRLAYMQPGKLSVGEYIRTLILERLEQTNPEEAKQIRDLRQAHKLKKLEAFEAKKNQVAQDAKQFIQRKKAGWPPKPPQSH